MKTAPNTVLYSGDNIRIEINHVKNGIEIYFSERPSEQEVVKILHRNKFKFYAAKKCWYMNNRPSTRAAALQIFELLNKQKTRREM